MKIVRIILAGFSIAALLIFALPLLFAVTLNIGNATGILVAVLLFAYALWMPKVHGIVRVWRKDQKKKWLVHGGFALLALIAVLVVTETGCMISAAAKRPASDVTVVVLGCRVYGERASLSLQERMEAAYDFLVENPEAVCVLSGGMGPGESISEAECMYRYLTAKGIAKERLYKEDKSTSTRENLQFSGELIEREGLNPVIAIATSEYHEYRAGQVAEELDMEYSAIPASTAWWLFPTSYIRELYGILAEWIL